MSRQRMREDERFWSIVKDLRWKLDDRTSGLPATGEPEFSYAIRGRSRRVPAWVVPVIAFMLGGATFGAALSAPAFVPLTFLVAAIGLGLLVRHR